MGILSRIVTRDRSRLGGLTGGCGRAKRSDRLEIASIGKKSDDRGLTDTRGVIRHQSQHPNARCVIRHGWAARAVWSEDGGVSSGGGVFRGVGQPTHLGRNLFHNSEVALPPPEAKIRSEGLQATQRAGERADRTTSHFTTRQVPSERSVMGKTELNSPY